jgi:hypothetical protein
MIYDLKIDENVVEGFNSNRTCSVYPSKRGDSNWEVGLHYMIFDKDNLSKFISQITLENYLSLKDSHSFEWLKSIQSVVGYNTESIAVEDEIYYYEGFDFFNFSPINGLKFFIEKNDETLTPIKLLFYENQFDKEIKIKVGETISVSTINNYAIFDLGFNKLNPQQVTITVDSVEYDITSIILNIKHSFLGIE